MGFGNPYGDPWNVEIVQHWVDHLADMGIKILALSDTIGVSNPENISYLFSNLIPPYPDVEFGAHLHTQPHNWREKVESAYVSGCRRFDAAMKGYGGCPMAKDELTGNMPTEQLLSYFDDQKMDLGINRDAFLLAMDIVSEVFMGRD
jgi:hydroxymethylglutaryl-CoA lyase